MVLPPFFAVKMRKEAAPVEPELCDRAARMQPLLGSLSSEEQSV
jgi:hypothetical protein